MQLHRNFVLCYILILKRKIEMPTLKASSFHLFLFPSLPKLGDEYYLRLHIKSTGSKNAIHSINQEYYDRFCFRTGKLQN